ncbi:YusW family protein [Geomicrobium sp. JCM 19038]|uniref:YusW family protein n=1 Tax=Geomicrobium sp. JCM 19038 TaxID=1460635 RepID=UPI00045F13B2|nr:YusW family protein [Geomicrobium sp. JCM 19038]GAK07097.1 hypothetical protein JCM19038_817 [Geomicrobium sp. JCM 19038]
MKKFLLSGLIATLVLTGCGNANDDPNENMDMDNDPAGDIEEDGQDDLDLGDDMEDTDTPEDGDGGNAMDEEGSAYDRGVVDFELDIEFIEGDDWEYDYEDEDGEVTASIERDNETIQNDEAITEIEQLLQDIELHGDADEEEMVTEVLQALDVSEDDVYKVELSIEFENGNMYNVDHTM